MAAPDLTSIEETNELPGGGSENADESRRYCWVCFATEDDDLTAAWVKPCKCRGTTKWVHETCLQRWIDEKQQGNSSTRVTCPQCGAEYIIIFPYTGIFVIILDGIDQIVHKACPFIAAGMVVGSVYWTAVTYGAVTVMQVIGQKEGLVLMEKADPLLLLICLPCIPLALILWKMLRWEEHLLQLLWKGVIRSPVLKRWFPVTGSNGSRNTEILPVTTDAYSATRILCGALILPTISTIVGRVLFEDVESSLHRTLLGGLVFMSVRGALKIYHRCQQHLRQSRRRVLNYDDKQAIQMQQELKNGETG